MQVLARKPHLLSVLNGNICHLGPDTVLTDMTGQIFSSNPVNPGTTGLNQLGKRVRQRRTMKYKKGRKSKGKSNQINQSYALS